MSKCGECISGKDCCFRQSYERDCGWFHPIDPPHPVPIQTNGDRIRAMTDEQWAELIDKTGCGLCGLLGIRDFCRASKDKNCYEIISAWLIQPAKEV